MIRREWGVKSQARGGGGGGSIKTIQSRLASSEQGVTFLEALIGILVYSGSIKLYKSNPRPRSSVCLVCDTRERDVESYLFNFDGNNVTICHWQSDPPDPWLIVSRLFTVVQEYDKPNVLLIPSSWDLIHQTHNWTSRPSRPHSLPDWTTIISFTFLTESQRVCVWWAWYLTCLCSD